jgi:hypothetical protein
MVVTEAMIIPPTDRVDESRFVQLADELCQVFLGRWRDSLLTPAFIVDDLERLAS